MTPWSVSPSAGWPNSAARAARASILHAPSSSEYSEWTCRWAHAEVLTDLERIGGAPDGAGPLPRVLPHVARSRRSRQERRPASRRRNRRKPPTGAGGGAAAAGFAAAGGGSGAGLSAAGGGS